MSDTRPLNETVCPIYTVIEKIINAIISVPGLELKPVDPVYCTGRECKLFDTGTQKCGLAL